MVGVDEVGEGERWGSKRVKSGSRSGEGDGGRCFGKGRRRSGSRGEASDIEEGRTMIGGTTKV